MRKDDLKRVRDAFASVIGEKAAEDIVPGATMEEIEGWDSLNFLNLIIAIEEEFDIQLTTLDAAGMTTVDAILAHLDTRAL